MSLLSFCVFSADSGGGPAGAPWRIHSAIPKQAKTRKKSGRGPERDRALRDSRLEQHELAIAYDQEFAHLRVAVADLSRRARDAQIAGERRVGIVDR